MSSKKLWGGRFTAEADSLFSEFNDSLSFDRELLEVDIEGSLAYARALQRAGVFSSKERLRVEDGLRRILDEHRADPDLITRSDAEDVHTYVEKALEKKIGPLALKLHTGRSRNDQVATDMRLYLRAKCREIEHALNELLQVLASRAEAEGASILPGYTHLQPAQPILFAHYLLAYGEQFLRDRERLRQCVARADICPLGSAAISGTVYPVDRRMLAKDLGFSKASENSMDSVSDRDFVLDFLYFASVHMMHLSRLAEDLVLYASTEFGFIQLDDRSSSGSSLMPQKKNPDALELIRGKSGRVYGHLLALLTVLKGLPMAYNKDLQEDKEGLFDSIKTVRLSIRMMALILRHIKILPQRMREACTRGYLNATELADYLVAKGVPFRKAHDTVGRVVLRAVALDLPLEELPLGEYRMYSELFTGDLYRSLRMEECIARRVEKGGTSSPQVRRAIRGFRARIDSGR